jgi:hypothetical protein
MALDTKLGFYSREIQIRRFKLNLIFFEIRE